MTKIYLKNFTVYLSDYLSLALLLSTVFFVLYFLLFDTSFLAGYGIFDNEILLGAVCGVSSFEICGLFLIYNYFKLKKKIFFSGVETEIDLYILLRFIKLRIISHLIRIVSLIVFFSPFLLSLSAIVYSADKGISEQVFIIFAVGCGLLFIISFLAYSVYIQKLVFLNYSFIKSPYMSYKALYELAGENSDGNLFKLFKLKLRNLPKKILSLLVFPAIYYLPSCLYDVYNFLYEKENPYPHKLNTEKTVVFYFEPIKGN